MELKGTMAINDRGHLEIGGCDTVDLAKQFGTPLYVIDEKHVRKMCREYKSSLEKHYGNGMVLYAGKAFLTTAMCKIIEQEGLGLDVVSGGELYTAASAAFPVEKIYMHGNNKTPDELELAIKLGISRIVIDSLYEIELVDDIAKKLGKTVDVSIRLKPGIEAHTHNYIQTGQLDSKFGLGIDDNQAFVAVERILSKKTMSLKGIHCHIGSQIFQIKPYKMAAEIMTSFMKEIQKRYCYTLTEINFGGGLGIQYTEEDLPLTPTNHINYLATCVKECCIKKGLDLPFILVEPGRSIIGESGITLYTVGTIKDIPGIRKYVSVDGGMTDNPRPALYQAKYSAVIANKVQKPKEEIISIAGKCCESGDMLIWDIKLPRVEPGDILAVLATGAYNYSMASNYNKLPIPAVVLVNSGRAELIVKRQSYEQLIQNDVLPDRLK
ncbi:MAG TPA: diaminopimelate decarboxylase [Clostridiales bacterium]|nr:diaminopimelate decarboxylase [Clostridiales bacterium]